MGYAPAPGAAAGEEKAPADGEGGAAPAAAGGAAGEGGAPPLRARDPLAELSAGQLLEAMRAGRLSPRELLETTLERVRLLDPVLHAFVHLAAEEARTAAAEAEERFRTGRPRELEGVPVVLKDLFDVRGQPTTAGSAVRAGRRAARDAHVVRLLREAGAVLVGKVSTHEFAFGVTTDTPFHGPTRNPWEPGHVPGGSSGGSAAAVAARVVPVALGTDTAGSVRIPAAACGVTGFKPTYGRIGRSGVVPLSWSQDHVGLLARSLEDVALVAELLAGPDPEDPAAHAAVPLAPGSARAAVARGRERPDLRGLRLGLPAGWLEDRVAPAVEERFRALLERAGAAGARLEAVELPPAPLLALLNRVVTLAEAGAYHAPFLARAGRLYSPDVRARLELGQLVPARDYLLAQRLRGELVRQARRAAAEVDALLTPTLPLPVPRIGQRLWFPGGRPEAVPDGLIRLTAGFSYLGFPALTLFAGTDPEGLPLGLQVVGAPGEDVRLLEVAAALERHLLA
ncbi:MAG: amidase, partial [Clostridia bacterium]|nr:amidase [Clostridia bacterium]